MDRQEVLLLACGAKCVGAGQATKAIQSYTSPDGCALSVAGVPFSPYES